MGGARRLVEVTGIIWLAVTLAFFALQLIPGDSALESLSAAGISQQIIESRREALGLTLPPLEQYAHYLAGLVTGNMGVSLQDGRPVAAIIAQQASATITLALAASVIALIFGLLAGMAAASTRRAALFGRLLLGLFVSVPVMWSGTLLFSLGGAATAHNSLAGLLLPALVLGLSGAGALGIVVEGAISDTRNLPFVTTARAKGLSERRIFLMHILRVSAGPILTAFVLQVGFLAGGVVLTETIFNRPGLGRLLVNAALRQDTPLVLGLVVWSAVLYAALLIAADFGTWLLDPRRGSQS